MCLTDTEFTTLMAAISYREKEFIKEISASKRLKTQTQAPEALNRLIEVRYKLYNLRCRGLQDTSKIGLS